MSFTATSSRGLATQSTAPALVEFKKEIQRLGKGPMPPEELAGLQKNLSRSYLQNFETLGQVIHQVSPLIANGVDLNFLEHYVDAMLKETPASVIATAAKHLSFEHSLVLIVGDLAVIEKPVRALGWGDVTVLDKEGKVLR